MKYKGEKEIFLIQSTEFPLQRALGSEIGAMLAKEHTEAGVKILAKESVTEILGCPSGNVRLVKLASGKEIPAGLVIMGKGVTPATEFLTETGIDLQTDGAISCNPFL